MCGRNNITPKPITITTKMNNAFKTFKNYPYSCKKHLRSGEHKGSLLSPQKPEILEIKNLIKDEKYYSFSSQIEDLIIHDKLRLQYGESYNILDGNTFDYYLKYLKCYFSSYPTDSWVEYFLDIYESMTCIGHWYENCKTSEDFKYLILGSFKMLTGKSPTIYLKQSVENFVEGFLIGFNAAKNGNVQGEENFDFLKFMRHSFDSTVNAIELPIIKKLTNLYTYLLVHGFLSKLGLNLNDDDYSRIQQKYMKVNYSSKFELWKSVIDCSLFICEKIVEYKQTGDICVFIHSSDEYSKWAMDADRIINLSGFTSNLAPHNTTYFTFLSDLDNCIERGESYAKYTLAVSGVDVSSLKRKLNTLQLIKNTEISKRSTQRERKSPFAVLIHGGSSIAKSSFSKMLFYYYANLNDLSNEDHFRYVRNPNDQFWSNFDTSKWCIHLDDIAFALPSKTAELDITLKELLNVKNNVSFVPCQAAIEDKGKTPVLSELLTATSNVLDLNVHEYFWCPVAVLRRFEMILTLTPKQKYLHENGKFIDPSKLDSEEGFYPDFWTIKVHKVIPHFDGRREMAKFDGGIEFDDINEFLRYYGTMCLEHIKTQEKAMEHDSYMREIKVCKKCLFVENACKCMSVQTLENKTNIFFEYFMIFCLFILNFLLECYFYLEMKFHFHQHLFKYKCVRNFVYAKILPKYNDNKQFIFLGHLNSILKKNKKLCTAISILSAISLATGLYFKFRKQNNKEEKETINNDTQEFEFETQGNKISVDSQLMKEKVQNVWYNPTVELNRFDLPPNSVSLTNENQTELRNIYHKNCIRLQIDFVKDGMSKCRFNNAIMLKGNLCLTNNHAFPYDVDIFTVKIISSDTSKSINQNTTFNLNALELVRDKGNDILLFNILCVPPFRDILKFWNITSIPLSKGLYLRRTKSGDIKMQQVHNLMFTPDFPVPELETTLSIIHGKVVEHTVKGDCGSLVLGYTPQGIFPIGLHILGHENCVGIIRLLRCDIEKLIDKFSIFNTVEQISDESRCTLDLQSENNKLIDLHPRSLIRYIPEGTCKVYGSLSGFRPKNASKVCLTPLNLHFQEALNIKVQHTKPVMTGYEPFKKNVISMIKPMNLQDNVILQYCVESFVQDVIKMLPSGWENQLEELDDIAAINGLPGVKFIDGINRSSSMGFPWCESKNKHLHDFRTEIYPQGVTFGEDIFSRVRDIEDKHKRGVRAFPIYYGHLKDEPVTFEKQKICKTRLFTGSPIDYNLHVRKQLLTFVRLFQKNKFAFEAAPGTACQSIEWSQFYDYLVHFGKDKIIEGDYKRFDKSMNPSFIRAAFRFISKIFSYTKYKDRHTIINAIGVDTAYPLCVIDGDIIEFFCSMPSGHPLTVIINSIVNCLYMRYAYYILHPQHVLSDFKENVHIMTYGDDNIMGVSDNAPFFTHTTVSETLATIGIEYTMGDKVSKSKPYVHIDNCKFLKRSWRYEEELKQYVCPLELDSIHKSLLVWVPSKTISPEAQMVAVIESANQEFFFHGKEIFLKMRELFVKTLEREPYSFYVIKPLPNWEELIETYQQRSNEILEQQALDRVVIGFGCPITSKVVTKQ